MVEISGNKTYHGTIYEGVQRTVHMHNQEFRGSNSRQLGVYSLSVQVRHKPKMQLQLVKEHIEWLQAMLQNAPIIPCNLMNLIMDNEEQKSQ